MPTQTTTPPEIQRALDAIHVASTALEEASRSATLAGTSHEIMAMHLHLVIINRSLQMIAARRGVVSRR
jgi:hypothetical protein